MKNAISLLSIQQTMQLAVQKGFQSDTFLSIVEENEIRSAQRRLEIYQDAYRIRMTSSVLDDFRRVGSETETESFEISAWKFVSENPSTVRNLAEYGRDFPSFIKTENPNQFRNAILDWLEVEALHASASEGEATPEDILNGLPFVLQISPATKIYDDSKNIVILYRKNNEVYEISLHHHQASLLSVFTEGKCPSELESIAEQHQMEAEQVASILEEWLSIGILYCRKQTPTFDE